MSSSKNEGKQLIKGSARLLQQESSGDFLWVPSQVRSPVDPPVAMLTLPSGVEERSSTLVFLMPKVL